MKQKGSELHKGKVNFENLEMSIRLQNSSFGKKNRTSHPNKNGQYRSEVQYYGYMKRSKNGCPDMTNKLCSKHTE